MRERAGLVRESVSFSDATPSAAASGSRPRVYEGPAVKTSTRRSRTYHCRVTMRHMSHSHLSLLPPLTRLSKSLQEQVSNYDLRFSFEDNLSAPVTHERL